MRKLLITPLIFEDQINLLPQIKLIKNYDSNLCYSIEFIWIKWGVSFDWIYIN